MLSLLCMYLSTLDNILKDTACHVTNGTLVLNASVTTKQIKKEYVHMLIFKLKQSAWLLPAIVLKLVIIKNL